MISIAIFSLATLAFIIMDGVNTQRNYTDIIVGYLRNEADKIMQGEH